MKHSKTLKGLFQDDQITVWVEYDVVDGVILSYGAEGPDGAEFIGYKDTVYEWACETVEAYLERKIQNKKP